SPRLVDLLEIASYVFSADCATSRGSEWTDDYSTEAWSSGRLARAHHYLARMRLVTGRAQHIHSSTKLHVQLTFGEILVLGGRLLFTSTAKPAVWNDAMTGLES